MLVEGGEKIEKVVEEGGGGGGRGCLKLCDSVL